MKYTDCPACGGTSVVTACDILTCDRPSLGKCCMCRKHVCAEHGGDLYGAILCHICFDTATVAQVDKAAKVSA